MLIPLINRLPKSFGSFLLVGGLGFLVDGVILSVLVHIYDWGDFTARLISFVIAAFITWTLNRRHTFAANASAKPGKEYSRYMAVQTFGSIINFSVYGICIATIPIMDVWPILALSVGVIIQIPFTFIGMKKFVFNRREEESE
ncbi:MAG: GtrA family protein [Pseudomonadota bacterium]|nr:GtrA family protein [Pseudomonadota bacterium]